MKNTINFCKNECPYFHDAALCISGEVCPLKKKKEERIQKFFYGIGLIIGFTVKVCFQTPLQFILFDLLINSKV